MNNIETKDKTMILQPKKVAFGDLKEIENTDEQRRFNVVITHGTLEAGAVYSVVLAPFDVRVHGIGASTS